MELEKLTLLQVYQQIARANFSADRGIRYGEDLYDARMQASRLCRITVPTHSEGRPEHGTTASTTCFTLSTFAPHEEVDHYLDGVQQEKEKREKSVGVEDLKLEGLKLDKKTQDEGHNTSRDIIKDAGNTTKTDIKKSTSDRNPLRMFGILTPPPLRLAQATSVKTISTLIPAILNLDNQMKEVEIQIRRARKHKLKAERQEAKVTEAKGTTDSNSGVDHSPQQSLTGSRETVIT